MSDTAVLDFCLDPNTLSTLEDRIPQMKFKISYYQLTLFDVSKYDKHKFGGERYPNVIPYVS